jgi:hypothetical protein
VIRGESFVATTLVVLLLAAGTGLGIVFARLWPGSDQHHCASTWWAPVPPPPGRLLERFRERLHLSDEQAEKVRAILDETHRRASAVFERVRPEVRAVMEASDERIRALLTAEQAAEYEKIVKDREEFHRRPPHFGPPGPPP